MLCMQGSANKEEARWYVGKRCAYVYKAKNKTSVPGQAEKSNLRCIWGKVSSTTNYSTTSNYIFVVSHPCASR